MKKKLLFLSRILVTIILISILWFFLKDNIDELLITLKAANKGLLVFGFALFCLNVVILSMRLICVLRTQNIKLTLRESVIINFIGFFFNIFLPTAVGGDIARGYYVSEKCKDKKLECYTSVIADRTIGLISIAFIAIIALFFVKSDLINFKIRLVIISIFTASTAFMIFSLNKKLAAKLGFLIKIAKIFKIEESVGRIYKVLNDFKYFKKESSFAFIIAFGGQILMITVAFIIAKSLNMDLPYAVFLLFMPIISIASMIPSLGGTGPREGAFVLLFGGITSEVEAGALALIWLTYFISLSIIGGVIYILSGYHKFSISEIEKMELEYDR